MEDPAYTDTYSQRLREEVDTLRHLSRAACSAGYGDRHPNVLGYIDSWEEDETLFIQTELCSLGNLAHFLWEYGRVFPKLDEPRVWKIFAELSSVSCYVLNSRGANVLTNTIGLALHPQCRRYSSGSEACEHLRH